MQNTSVNMNNYNKCLNVPTGGNKTVSEILSISEKLSQLFVGSGAHTASVNSPL